MSATPAWVAQVEAENDRIERQRTAGHVVPAAQPQFTEMRERSTRERAAKLNQQ
jgi:hypothetical protein